jgi:hypothetical protein
MRESHELDLDDSGFVRAVGERSYQKEYDQVRQKKRETSWSLAIAEAKCSRPKILIMDPAECSRSLDEEEGFEGANPSRSLGYKGKSEPSTLGLQFARQAPRRPLAHRFARRQRLAKPTGPKLGKLHKELSPPRRGACGESDRPLIVGDTSIGAYSMHGRFCTTDDTGTLGQPRSSDAGSRSTKRSFGAVRCS